MWSRLVLPPLLVAAVAAAKPKCFAPTGSWEATCELCTDVDAGRCVTSGLTWCYVSEAACCAEDDAILPEDKAACAAGDTGSMSLGKAVHHSAKPCWAPQSGWDVMCFDCQDSANESGACTAASWAPCSDSVEECCEKSGSVLRKDECRSKGASKVDADGVARPHDCQYAVSKEKDWTNNGCNELCLYDETLDNFYLTCKFERWTIEHGRTKPEGDCYSGWIYGYSDAAYEADRQVVAMHGPHLVNAELASFGDNKLNVAIEFKQDVPTPADCQKLCQWNDDCVNFVWTATEVSGKSQKLNCILKSQKIVDNALAIELTSGVIPGSTDERWEWCNMNMGHMCSHGMDCLGCSGKQMCVWESHNHISGPKYCSKPVDHCDATGSKTTTTTTTTPTTTTTTTTPKLTTTTTTTPTTTTIITTTTTPKLTTTHHHHHHHSSTTKEAEPTDTTRPSGLGSRPTVSPPSTQAETTRPSGLGSRPTVSPPSTQAETTRPAMTRKVSLEMLHIQDVSFSYVEELPKLVRDMPKMFQILEDNFPDSRFGLASFVDKPLPPFGRSNDYCYKLHTAVSKDTKEVHTHIKNLKIQSGDDWKECQLDALHHAFLTPEENGFSNRKHHNIDGVEHEVLKVIVIATDAGYHVAGDENEGEFQVRPNNGDAELRCGSEGYVSIKQVRSAVVASDMYPIFLVTDEVMPNYRNLLSRLNVCGAVVRWSLNSSASASSIQTAITEILECREAKPRSLRAAVEEVEFVKAVAQPLI